MKTPRSVTVCVLAVLFLLSLAIPAAAVELTVPTEWNFSWTVTGDLVGPGPTGPVPVIVEGTSRAQLVPRPDLESSFPHFPPEHVYRLSFEHNGQHFGGVLANGSGWGPTTWELPVFGTTGGVGGSFGIDAIGDHFSLDVGGLGHFGPQLSGTGTRVSAAEPQLALLVAGALGLAIRWRRRHSDERQSGALCSRRPQRQGPRCAPRRRRP
jgi:hypothetical protein